MSLQKQRIVSLEHEVRQKDRVIQKLKARQWAGKPVKVSLKRALIPLKKEIRKKNWVEALKLSAPLKKRYPRSIQVARYRSVIFEKMGLLKQARVERQKIKKLQALKMKKSMTR